jgi:hypothetical protein
MSEVNNNKNQETNKMVLAGGAEESVDARMEIPLEEVYSLQTAMLVIDALQKQNSLLKETIKELEDDSRTVHKLFRGAMAALVLVVGPHPDAEEGDQQEN